VRSAFTSFETLLPLSSEIDYLWLSSKSSRAYALFLLSSTRIWKSRRSRAWTMQSWNSTMIFGAVFVKRGKDTRSLALISEAERVYCSLIRAGSSLTWNLWYTTS